MLRRSAANLEPAKGCVTSRCRNGVNAFASELIPNLHDHCVSCPSLLGGSELARGFEAPCLTRQLQIVVCITSGNPYNDLLIP